MKKRYWILGATLMLCLVLFVMQPTFVQASTGLTVYLDPVSGNDSADGLTEATAVASYDAAYAKVKEADGGTIVLLSTLTISGEKRLPDKADTVPVVLTSKTGAEGIASDHNVRFMCPTTLEKLTMTLTKASSSYAICGEGKKLVIGQNVTSVGTDGYNFNLIGGARWGKCASTDLTVQSGTWRNIYVGTYGYTSGSTVAGVTGNAKLTMTGGELTGFIAPSYQSNAVVGSMDIALSNVSIGTIYCAAVSSGTVSGDVNLTLGENTYVSGSVYAGGNGAGSVTGNVNIVLDGADTTGYGKLSGGGSSSFTGTVGAAKLTLKSGILGVSPTGMTTTNIAVESGKTLTINNAQVKADLLSCGGTLAFTGTGQVNATAVNGKVSCTVTDQVIGLHTYLTAPAGSDITFTQTGIAEENGVWRDASTDTFKGLVLTAAEDVKIRFYKGFSSDSDDQIQPAYSEGNTHYYPVSAGGKYRYVSQGTTSGKYYQYVQNVYITEEEAQVKTVINVTPDLRGSTVWNPLTVKRFTDEAMARFPTDKSLWPDYQDVFTTPAYDPDKPANEITTQDELEAFIDKLDDENDNMYVFIAGQSAGTPTFDIPLVIFTELDLSGCKTIAEAAALIRADGKLVVHEQAQMHGNEQASGEAALALMQRLDGAYGDSLLEDMNIYMLPRVNPYGAYKNQRNTYNPDDRDLNGDFMRQTMPEVWLCTEIQNMFDPDVVLDNHEYQIVHENTSAKHNDLMICAHVQTEYADAFKNQSSAMVKAMQERLTENNLTYGWYTDWIWGRGAASNSGYSSNRGALFFLMESHGIFFGTQNYERRMMAHISALTGVFDYLKENHETVRTIVRAEKQRIIDLGKTYEEEDQIILKASEKQNPDREISGYRVNLATGKLTAAVFPASTPETVERARPLPTAYVISASHSAIDKILALADRLFIEYTLLPENSVISLRGYHGTTELAEVTEEQAVRFADGAYVFCMNQITARFLAYLMEPDLNINKVMSLVQQGIVSPVNGDFPMYRYEHDLNSSGMIDYTVAALPAAPADLTANIPGGEILGLQADRLYEYRADGETAYTPVAAGATKITGLAADAYYVRYCAGTGTEASEEVKLVLFDKAIVYVDKPSGSNSNSGFTEADPVSTFAQAVIQLKLRRQHLPEDAEAVMVLLTDYEISTKITNFASHDFPIIVTSKDGTVGIKRTATAQYNRLSLGGDLTFKNLTLTVDTPDSYNYLLANGHKLIIGENVNCVGPYYYNLVGGQFQSATGSTYLEVHSGIWQNIYFGGYQGQTNGDATLIMTGGTVRNSVMASYNKAVTGDMTVDIRGATITKQLYLGVSGAATVDGDLNATLGQGMSATDIYVGGDKGSISGTATVIVDGADLTDILLSGKPKGTGSVTKSILVYKSGTLGSYSGFTEFADQSVTLLPGDIDGDDDKDTDDAVYLLLSVMFGTEDYPVPDGTSLDFDGDGTVTTDDAVYLLLHVMFGAEDYPLAA